jgi:3-oxoacyl-[acyl-carrier protein] reductase
MTHYLSPTKKRVVIVTGASRGLGREIALQFGAAGCRVVVNYREREEDARTVAEEILKRGGEAIVLRADVRRPKEVDSMINEALQRWGSINVLINNAGMTRDALAMRLDEGDWDAVMDTNLKGPFLCMRAVSRAMMKQRSGHIISIASIAGVRGRKGQANYAASKAGLIGLTKAAAKELGRSNIQVNCVLPGYLPTDMGTAAPESVLAQMIAETALGRMSNTAEVASFIIHLSLMKNVSGQVFNLDSRVL